MNDTQVVELVIALRNSQESLFGATRDFINRCNGKNGADWQKLHQSLVDTGLGAVVTKAPVQQVSAEPSNIITIDRSNGLLEPTDFGQEIISGFKTIETDLYTPVLGIQEINSTLLVSYDMLKDGETKITGEERRRRMRAAGYVGFDLAILQSLLENSGMRKGESLLETLYSERGCKYVDAMSQPLLSTNGYAYIAFLFRSESGGGGWWGLSYASLSDTLSAEYPSTAIGE